MRKALESDPENATAHFLLDEAKHGSTWMPAEEAEAREAEEMGRKGLVYYGSKWIQPKEAEALRAKDRKQAGWPFEIKVKTARVTVYSGRDLAYTRAMAGRIEHAVEAYAHVYGPIWKLSRTPPHLVVHLYPDADSYRKHANPFYEGGIPESVMGFYAASAVYLGVVPGCEAGIEKTAVHESVHALDYSWGFSVSKGWLAEGRADYFGYSVHGRRVLPGKVRIPAGDGRPEDLKRILPRASLTELVDNPKEFYKDMDANYALSWAFIHFLFQEPQADRFRKFLADRAYSYNTRQQLEAALGSSLKDLEPAFRDYAEKTLLTP